MNDVYQLEPFYSGASKLKYKNGDEVDSITAVKQLNREFLKRQKVPLDQLYGAYDNSRMSYAKSMGWGYNVDDTAFYNKAKQWLGEQKYKMTVAGEMQQAAMSAIAGGKNYAEVIRTKADEISKRQDWRPEMSDWMHYAQQSIQNDLGRYGNDFSDAIDKVATYYQSAAYGDSENTVWHDAAANSIIGIPEHQRAIILAYAMGKRAKQSDEDLKDSWQTSTMFKAAGRSGLHLATSIARFGASITGLKDEQLDEAKQVLYKSLASGGSPLTGDSGWRNFLTGVSSSLPEIAAANTGVGLVSLAAGKSEDTRLDLINAGYDPRSAAMAAPVIGFGHSLAMKALSGGLGGISENQLLSKGLNELKDVSISNIIGTAAAPVVGGTVAFSAEDPLSHYIAGKFQGGGGDTDTLWKAFAHTFKNVTQPEVVAQMALFTLIGSGAKIASKQMAAVVKDPVALKAVGIPDVEITQIMEGNLNNGQISEIIQKSMIKSAKESMSVFEEANKPKTAEESAGTFFDKIKQEEGAARLRSIKEDIDSLKQRSESLKKLDIETENARVLESRKQTFTDLLGKRVSYNGVEGVLHQLDDGTISVLRDIREATDPRYSYEVAGSGKDMSATAWEHGVSEVTGPIELRSYGDMETAISKLEAKSQATREFLWLGGKPSTNGEANLAKLQESLPSEGDLPPSKPTIFRAVKLGDKWATVDEDGNIHAITGSAESAVDSAIKKTDALETKEMIQATNGMVDDLPPADKDAWYKKQGQSLSRLITGIKDTVGDAFNATANYSKPLREHLVDVASAKNQALAKAHFSLYRVLQSKLKDINASIELAVVISQDRKFAKVDSLMKAIDKGGDNVKELKAQLAEVEGKIIFTEDEFLKKIAEPDIAAMLERHKKYVQPELLKMHLELGGKEAEVGKYTGAFLSDVPISQAEETGAIRNGNDLRKQMKGKSAQRKKYAGTMAAEELADYATAVRSLYSKQYGNFTKAKFYNAAESEGILLKERPANRMIKGEDAMPITVDENKTYWAPKSVRNDIKAAFGMRELDANPVAQLSTAIQAAGVGPISSDILFHTVGGIKNMLRTTSGANTASRLASVLGTGLPKLPSALYGITKNMVKIYKDNPEVLAAMERIADAGASRNYDVELGSLWKPHTWMQLLDKSMRLTSNESYEQAVKLYPELGTKMERRMWINKLGRYEEKMLPDSVFYARRYGLSPFAVGGLNTTVQAMKFGATPLQVMHKYMKEGEIKKYQVESLATWTAAMTMPFIINSLLWGDPVPEGTKYGSIKLDDGKELDAWAWSGLDRAYKAFGLAQLRNRDKPFNPSYALGDTTAAAVHPFVGPGLSMFYTWATGQSVWDALHGGKQLPKFSNESAMKAVEDISAVKIVKDAAGAINGSSNDKPNMMDSILGIKRNTRHTNRGRR